MNFAKDKQSADDEQHWQTYALEESLNILWSFNGTDDEENAPEFIIEFLMDNIQLSITEAHMLLGHARSVHETRMITGFYDSCPEEIKTKRWFDI